MRQRDGRINPSMAPSGLPWFAATRLHCVADAAVHGMALLFGGRVEVKVASGNSKSKLFAWLSSLGWGCCFGGRTRDLTAPLPFADLLTAAGPVVLEMVGQLEDSLTRRCP